MQIFGNESYTFTMVHYSIETISIKIIQEKIKILPGRH